MSQESNCDSRNFKAFVLVFWHLDMVNMVKLKMQSPSDTQGSGYKIRHNGFRLSVQHATYTVVQRSLENRHLVKPLVPNDIYIHIYICHTAQLTFRRCILNIYSKNILTEYFKHVAHSPFFSLQDAVYFTMLSFLIPVIFTF